MRSFRGYAWRRRLRHGRRNEPRRNEPGRHVLGEWDAAADRNPHGGEPGAAEEAAAIEVCSAAEGHRIGAFTIVLVEFLERALGLARHGVTPW